MVTLTPDELNDLRVRINAGELPKDALEQYRLSEERNVFGHDAKKDRAGNYIEMGIGSEQQPSFNSVEAYAKYGRDEPDYERNLAKMRKALADYQARKKAGAAQRQPIPAVL